MTYSLQDTRHSLALISIAGVLAFSALSCGGGGSSQKVSSGTIKANVLPLASDGSILVSNITQSSVTLTGKLPALSPGTVIVGGESPGIMRKVLSVNQVGNSATVQTADATLSDVFEQARIRYSGPVVVSAFIGFGAADPHHSISSRAPRLSYKLSAAKSVQLAIPLNNVIESATGGAAVTLAGSASIGISIDCDIEIDSARNVHYAKFIPTATGTLTLTATSVATASLSLAPIQLGRLQCEPIRILVAGVPVWISPQISLSSMADGEVSTGMNVVTFGQIAIGVGFTYQDGAGLGPVTTYKQNFNITPNAPATADAICHITPLNIKFEALIDGVGGPYATLDCPKFTFGLHTSPPPFTIDADFDGDVGLTVDAFGFDNDIALLTFDQSYRLFPAGQIPDGIYVNTNWPVGLLGPGYNFHFLVSGGVIREWSCDFIDRYLADGTGVGFLEGYSFPSPTGQADFLKQYTLSLSNGGGSQGTYGGYVLPAQPPSQVEVEARQISSTSIQLDVSGAPSWMMPTWGSTYTLAPPPTTSAAIAK